ncbi:hypothetical protein J6590_007028 [Homalodisca vitripennis]|nr:hypothetical protein J6590_007028 [Homalodisca vitripennis]
MRESQTGVRKLGSFLSWQQQVSDADSVPAGHADRSSVPMLSHNFIIVGDLNIDGLDVLKGDPLFTQNYRPISVLPATIYAIARLVDMIVEGIKSQRDTLSVFLDLELTVFNIKPSFTNWNIEGYEECHKIDLNRLRYVVPQGSILSSLFFLIYFNDVGSSVTTDKSSSVLMTHLSASREIHEENSKRVLPTQVLMAAYCGVIYPHLSYRLALWRVCSNTNFSKVLILKKEVRFIAKLQKKVVQTSVQKFETVDYQVDHDNLVSQIVVYTSTVVMSMLYDMLPDLVDVRQRVVWYEVSDNDNFGVPHSSLHIDCSDVRAVR